MSVNSSGDEASNVSGSSSPSLSADGRYVACDSLASNLVQGDTNRVEDIFVHDTETGITTRVSKSSAGDEGNVRSENPTISADGRYVAFESRAYNLTAGDTNDTWDIFVHDTQTGITTLVGETVYTVVPGIFPGTNDEVASDNRYPSISADGRYVAFESIVQTDFTGIVPRFDSVDIFVHDTQTGVATRASESSAGDESNNFSFAPSVSADGRYVAFSSFVASLVAGDTNGESDIIIRSIPNPTITSVIPDHLPIGATTSVEIKGSDFLEGATPAFGGGIISNVVIVDENTLTFDVEIPGNRSAGARNLMVNLFGRGPGPISGSAAICENCITFQ